MNSKRADYIIPVVISILFFLAKKQIIPSYIYLVIVIPSGFYYIPVKLILFFRVAREPTMRDKLKVITSNLNYYLILFLSILKLFLEVNKELKVFIALTALVTCILFFYYLTADRKSNISIVYLLFLFLISGVLFT
jgi:hypothetical protein